MKSYHILSIFCYVWSFLIQFIGLTGLLDLFVCRVSAASDDLKHLINPFDLTKHNPPKTLFPYNQGLGRRDESIWVVDTIPPNSVKSSLSGIPSSKPAASAMGDNLAVNITWLPFRTAMYQIEYKYKSIMDRQWSKPMPVVHDIEECCGRSHSCCMHLKHHCITNRQTSGLQPGRRYKFRIVGNLRGSLIQKTPWSNVVSFEHVSKVAPVITETERLSDGGIKARWTLAVSAVGFPVDHFFLLYRMQDGQANGVVTYQPFQHSYIPGANAREHVLTDLIPENGYQLVVYGAQVPRGHDPHRSFFTGGQYDRRITKFSHEVFVGPKALTHPLRPSGDKPSDKSKISSHGSAWAVSSSVESNRLMFLILGALAGMMLIVMLCLVILCVCRQTRKRSQTACRLRKGDSANTEQTYSFPPSLSHQHCSSFLLSKLPSSPQNDWQGSMMSATHQLQPDSRVTSPINASYPPPPCSPPPPPQSLRPDGDLHFPRNMVSSHDTVSPNATGSTAFMSPQLRIPTRSASHYLWLGRDLPDSPLAPFSLKREPPSGGSVHEESCDGSDVNEELNARLLQLRNNTCFDHCQHLPRTSEKSIMIQQYHHAAQSLATDPTNPPPRICSTGCPTEPLRLRHDYLRAPLKHSSSLHSPNSMIDFYPQSHHHSNGVGRQHLHNRQGVTLEQLENQYYSPFDEGMRTTVYPSVMNEVSSPHMYLHTPSTNYTSPTLQHFQLGFQNASHFPHSGDDPVQNLGYPYNSISPHETRRAL